MIESVRRVMQLHLGQRPLMEVQDAYKLLYQSIMGLGHMLTDTGRARSYLFEELAAISADSIHDSLIEDIALNNDMVRINLRPFKAQGLNVEKLFAAMLDTEKLNTAAITDFIPVWSAFEQLVESKELTFPPEQTREFSSRVQKANFPVIHHSDSYMQLYQPAYRVMNHRVFVRAFATDLR